MKRALFGGISGKDGCYSFLFSDKAFEQFAARVRLKALAALMRLVLYHEVCFLCET